jgi:acyl carrier protein
LDPTVDKRAIESLLFTAVAEVNRQLPKDRRLDPTRDTRLSGAEGRLDSLGILNLLVLAEQRIQSTFGIDVLLADDEALAREPSPFLTLGTLADHMQDVVERARGR